MKIPLDWESNYAGK